MSDQRYHMDGPGNDQRRPGYDQRRRARMRAMRRRKVRRQRMIVAAVFALLVLLISVLAVRAYQSAQDRKRAEAVRSALAVCFEETVNTAENAGATPEEELPDGQAFAAWAVETYPAILEGSLADKAEAGEKLSAKDVYDNFGSTLYVLNDEYTGKLKDAETAKENGIYISGQGKAGKNAESVHISVAGDLCFAEDGFVLDHYDEVNDLEKCISPQILDITKSADIFFINHEYAISDRGEPLEGKYYTFRARPERMALLQEMGTDLVSLANNHVYDYGPDALLDTADLLDEAGIPYVGGGRDIEEAKRPVYFISNGIKIGFVGASSAEQYHFTPQATEDSPGILEAYDTAEFNQVISEASKECDYLIAYIHWGPEDEEQYADYQTEEGKEFLASGADIVVGGHPHVLEGIEYTDDGPIVYSMGDFWFNDETKYTGLLNLKIDADGLDEMSFTPCQQRDYTTQYLEGKEEQREMFDFLEGLSPNISIDDNGVITKAQE